MTGADMKQLREGLEWTQQQLTDTLNIGLSRLGDYQRECEVVADGHSPSPELSSLPVKPFEPVMKGANFEAAFDLVDTACKPGHRRG